ncbi:MAG TPA: DUF58 domain-containing protein [bacterium]|nr:DUF58 domain-containing protein [bacterium]
MIPKEILKKVRHIEIRTSRIVNDIFAGEYESVFKGRGMEFDAVREYQPGDEVRSIDWNVTARMGHPYVKRFVEERELTVMLVVDMSSSGKFGSVKWTKRDMAAELCAVLAFAAIKNNDKVGLIAFTDRIEKFIPPKKGSKHVLRVIRELLYLKPEGRRTDIACALEYLNKVSTRRTVTFLASDFMASGYEKALSIAHRRHDVVALRIADPRESDLPPVGFIELEDEETGDVILIDTGDAAVRAGFSSVTRQDKERREDFFKSIGLDFVTLQTDKPYIEPLMRFFRMRERRL